MAPSTIASAFAGLIALTAAQQIGTVVPEEHPRLITQKCTTAGGCVDQDTSVVIDAGSRQLLDIETGQSCYSSSGGIDTSICNSVETCGTRCAFQGVDYAANGVTTSGSSLNMRQYVRKNGQLQNVSPRVYLLDESTQEYVDMKLLNQELTFDVDMDNLPCGMNAAFYLGEMDADGGRSDVNPAGATYGTGYCDAQCYTPTWLNGKLNTEGLGACCNEMDVWEANARATGYTPHPCQVEGFYGCSGDECSLETGVCDKWGCGLNPYAEGSPGYYGLGNNFTLDSSKPFTVQTQFVADNNKTTGVLKEIRRNYIQDGKLIGNVVVNAGDAKYDSISTPYCTTFGAPYFFPNGGLPTMGEALARGMILTFSIWSDSAGFMNWLDSGSVGPCNATEGDPKIIEQTTPDTDVTWSNIRWGDIGSTISYSPSYKH